MTEIIAVKDYWERHPLYSYEIKYPLGSLEYYREVDRIKKNDAERFSLPFWNFKGYVTNKAVLDIGCGPGFLTRFYASKGYRVTAVDISDVAVNLTRRNLELCSLKADVLQGNAEALEFKDNSFDYIVSAGVLHHTPDIKKAVLEAFRVLKPGGRTKITLYYKNALLRYPFWHLTKILSKVMFKNIAGRVCLCSAGNPDEFIRRYDGDDNPVGKGYTLSQARQLFSPPFIWLNHEIHYFPFRFMPALLQQFVALHKILDRNLGTMIYINLMKVQ